jgi:histidine phosphotransfer protein HptB
MRFDSGRSCVVRAVLAELVDAIGPDATVEVIGVFRSSAGEGVAATMQALARGDLTEAGRQAHALKSSSALVGALALSEAMEQIERAAGAADRRAAEAAGARLPMLLAESLSAVEGTLAALTAQATAPPSHHPREGPCR